MKKLLVFVITAIVLVGVLMACGNRQLLDTTWSFDRAILKQADGTIVSGKVESWTDYEDSDMVQVKIDGVTYFTHIVNVTMITE